MARAISGLLSRFQGLLGTSLIGLYFCFIVCMAKVGQCGDENTPGSHSVHKHKAQKTFSLVGSRGKGTELTGSPSSHLPVKVTWNKEFL